MSEVIRTDNTDVIANACKKIAELEKENAELKEINEGYCRNRDRLIAIGFPNFKDCKEYAEHLTKAKEIIKKLMVFAEMDDREYEKEYKEAEQFLYSEVEK